MAPQIRITIPEQKSDPWVEAWAAIFRHFVGMVREIEKDRQHIAVSARVKPDKAAIFAKLSVEAEWWRYYDMSEFRHFALAMFHIGLVPDMFRTAVQGIRLRNFLPPLLKEVEYKEIDPRSPKRALGAAWSLGNALRAYIICGESLHRLVARADRDTDALKLALRIDPLTLYCKPIQKRMARAAAEHDSAFLHGVGEALQTPKTMSSEQYPELQGCLLMLRKALQLPHLNEARATQLFLVRLADLHLYSSDSRSLIRFIQRFSAKAATKKR